jgi:predicted dinucleotide-binding enzyme
MKTAIIGLGNIGSRVANLARHLSERSLSIHPTRSRSTARAALRRLSGPTNLRGRSLPGRLPKELNSCSISVQSLEAAANRKPELAVLFYATDYPEAGGAVAKLIAASGFAPVSVGGIDQSVRIEAFGELNEYGKLGSCNQQGGRGAHLTDRPIF